MGTTTLQIIFCLWLWVAYQRGKKKRWNFYRQDLAEIPPLKTNLGLKLWIWKNLNLKAGGCGLVDNGSKFDNSAKSKIAGYAVTKFKIYSRLFKHFELTLGVDNLFDKVYNSTNTYQDIRYMQSW